VYSVIIFALILVFFPAHMFRMYTFDEAYRRQVFGELLEIKDNLASTGIIPSEDNADTIFPELSDLLDEFAKTPRES